jgi:hypothetical protein
MGMPTTCRNWSGVLKSKKRYLVDKFFEKVFKDLLEKLPRDDRGRIEVDLNRFAAKRYADSGSVDIGNGDTLFMQLMRRVKQDDPSFNAWRKNGLDSAVFRANFLHEGSIDAGGPYRAT